VNKGAMLIPKTGHPSDHLPTLMDFSEAICPPERRALREIVETAEVVREGDHLYLLARVSAATLDSLATFETSREDLEVEPDVEQVNEDGTNESALEWNGSSSGHAMIQDDREFDCPAARQRFIAERQEPPRERRYVDLWIAERLGLTGADAEAYAKEVVVADFDKSGDAAILRKVLADLSARNIDLSEHRIAKKMEELTVEAKEQIMTG
jgi:hypothetical protein